MRLRACAQYHLYNSKISFAITTTLLEKNENVKRNLTHPPARDTHLEGVHFEVA